jgi:hypothetical protein
MNRGFKVLFLSIVTMSLLAGGSFAADDKTGPNVGGKEAAAPDKLSGVATVETASNLAIWARANKDPVTLATAAKVLSSAGATPMENPKKAPEAPKTPADAGKQAPAPKEFTPASLLAEARTMAGDNKEQLTAIDAIEKSITTARGAVGGPKVDDDVLAPGEAMDYTIVFAGDEPMDIAVVTDIAGAIRFKVYDENGNQITTDYTDHFEMTPRWTGPFKIVLTNETAGYVPYGFATN